MFKKEITPAINKKYKLSSVRASSSMVGSLRWCISMEETVRSDKAMHRKRKVFYIGIIREYNYFQYKNEFSFINI